MSTTVFHCLLCPIDADGHYPEFTSGTAMKTHLDTVHSAPKRYVMMETQHMFNEHAFITQWKIEDANGRIVGGAQTVTRRPQ
jgi:hypothetical protein